MVSKKYKVFGLSYCQNSVYVVIKLVGLLILHITELSYVHDEEREEYEMINITAGQVGILDDQDGSQRYGMGYRFTSFSGPWGFRLIPAIGAAAANNGARFCMLISGMIFI